MNERITLLALEASDPKTGWLDRQKFAELIVGECAWLVDENDISLPYGTFGKLIKGHFGVE